MSIPKKKKRTSKYDANLRIAIAQEYLTSDQGYVSLSKKYNIARSTVRDFVTWYKEKYSNGIELPKLDAPQPMSKEDLKDCYDLSKKLFKLLLDTYTHTSVYY